MLSKCLAVEKFNSEVDKVSELLPQEAAQMHIVSGSYSKTTDDWLLSI